jgi:tetratricopeptide (TPR) repeat protein
MTAPTTSARSSEKGVLVLYASLEQGNLLVSSGPDLPSEPNRAAVEKYVAPRKQALQLWKRAAAFRSEDPVLGAELNNRVEAVCIGAANELKEQSRPYITKKNWTEEIAMLNAAIDLLKIALEFSRTDRIVNTLSALLLERGLSHLECGNKMSNQTSAINDFDEARRLTPNDESATRRAAGAHNTRGCNSENRNAIADFNQAIALYPMATYYANRAMSHMESRDYDDAIEDLTSACKLDRKDEYVKLAASAFNGKGMKIMKQYEGGYLTPPIWELQEAQTYFKGAMELDPSNDTYRSNYRIVTQRMGGR